MDIDKLRHFLKDEYTYEETTKEIFLYEIESIFEAHRNSGDTELLLYPGVCDGKTCENCGKKGFRFVGNKSKNYMDLIFEIEEDDIKDIFSCGEFKSNTEIPELETKASIYIHLDDCVSFPKTHDYWARVYAAQDAYNELITTPPRTLDFDEFKYWLDKHAELYNRLGGYDFLIPQMKWTPFLIHYSDLKALDLVILENLDEITCANEFFKHEKTENELIDWLLKYEPLYVKGSIDIPFVIVKDGENFHVDSKDNFLLRGEIFSETFHFFEFYTINHRELLEKYSTFSSWKEMSELYNEENRDEGLNDYYSLQFHLNRRKELEKTGVNLPFYLKKLKD